MSVANQEDEEMPPLGDHSEDSSDEEDIPLRSLIPLRSRTDERVALRAPRSLTAIDTDDAVDHCDMCQKTLDAEDTQCRAFRCFTCELGVQCETCCSGTHLSRTQHILQEWDHQAAAWGAQAGMSTFWSTMVKACGECEMELASQSVMLPEGTVMCMNCGPKLLCTRCCLKGHQTKPLHKIKVWEPTWQQSTLAHEGLVVNLGHRGEPCLWPVEPPKGLTIIAWDGYHRVNVRYCGCGKFERNGAGDWAQIRASGWHRAGITGSRICATFEVMTRAMEMYYEKEEAKAEALYRRVL
ncbi:hypothetical protein C8R47DRAFT_1230815 [Mycena vitilis]|nr:hypothetical protein C8R47DRAFT_1230815 [Mycena vitilis]